MVNVIVFTQAMLALSFFYQALTGTGQGKTDATIGFYGTMCMAMLILIHDKVNRLGKDKNAKA